MLELLCRSGTIDQLSDGRKEQQAWTSTRKPGTKPLRRDAEALGLEKDEEHGQYESLGPEDQQPQGLSG